MRVARDVRRVSSREVVDRREWPNFRDSGRMVDRPLLRLATNLQGGQGRGWASEGGLRKMICEDTGHMPGTTTVAKALKRLGAQGLVVHVWITRGQILPNGEVCKYGTRIVWVPKTDKQRLAAQRFHKTHPSRAPYRTRRVGFDARTLVAKIAGAERPSMPPAAPDTRAIVAREIARLQEFAAAHWGDDDERAEHDARGPPKRE